MTVVLALYYVWANRQKAAADKEMSGQSETELWKDLTDKENTAFRYVY